MGYVKDEFAFLIDGFEPSKVLVIYLASLDVIYFSKKNVIFFADAKSDIIFVPSLVRRTNITAKQYHSTEGRI